MHRFHLFLLVCVLFPSCKTSKPVRPVERYQNYTTMKPSSIINIPAKLDLKEVEQLINVQLDELMKNEEDMQKLGGKDMDIRIEKSENITISAQDKDIEYRVPLQLFIAKDVGITNLKAQGEIALTFTSSFDIQEDWSLTTNTEVNGYEWLKKPVLKLGFIDVPIEFVANRVLESGKVTICEAIDKAIEANFNLKEQVEQTWNQLQEPIVISPENQLWLRISPEKVGMSPMKTSGNVIQSTISVVTQSEIFIGDRPESIKQLELPSFQWMDNGKDDFKINISAEISYPEAEKIAKLKVIGETYTHMNRSVEVEDIHIYGQDDKMVVDTKLSGSYNGNIYLTGIPVFNQDSNTIEVDDLDYELKTKNFLFKTANWLLKKGMKSSIKENLKFPLKEEIDNAIKTVNKELKNFMVNEDINIQGHLEELIVEKTELTPTGIKVNISSVGKLDVNVKGFGSLLSH